MKSLYLAVLLAALAACSSAVPDDDDDSLQEKELDEDCVDGNDNDNDGLVDCEDPVCCGSSWCEYCEGQGDDDDDDDDDDTAP